MKRKGYISGLLPAVSAALLCVWYLLSVVGLDVHSDNEHGRTYVVSGLTGGNCEAIHPEHHCHDCDHADGECLEGEECCSDSFEAVLSVGGAPDAPVIPAASLTALALPPTAADLPAPLSFCAPHRLHAPPPGGGDLLLRICVLRA